MTRRSLVGHTIICGFGTSGEVAAKELLLIGQDPESILVIDRSPQRIEEAVALGLIGIVGDARSNAALKAAKISTATALLVATSLDDATALVVLSARQLNAAVKISVSVRAQENESIMYQAGANVVINPVNLGGHLLARSSAHQHAVDYLRDLGVVSPNPRNFPLQPANFLMRSARRPNASSTHSIVMGSARAARREFL